MLREEEAAGARAALLPDAEGREREGGVEGGGGGARLCLLPGGLEALDEGVVASVELCMCGDEGGLREEKARGCGWVRGEEGRAGMSLYRQDGR